MHPPPVGLTELESISGGLVRWDQRVTARLVKAAESLGDLQKARFAAALPQGPGPVLEVPVLWNAFPRSLLMRFGRERALALADMPWPYRLVEGQRLPSEPLQWTEAQDAGPWARPQDEYCEWRVVRDPWTGRIRQIVFTCETAEYWHVLFHAAPDLAARMYAGLVSATVEPADLTVAGGAGYAPLNRWNTTHGIVHMVHPSNELGIAMVLCADSTRLFRHADGTPLTVAEGVACAAKADANRASDLSVTGTLNALARQGASLTLADPVGICIHEIDTAGWHLAGVDDAASCCRIDRGVRGAAMRVVVEAPPGSGRQLDQLRIGDEPLVHGGQIAECITMRMSAKVRLGGSPPAGEEYRPAPFQAFVPSANRRLLLAQAAGDAARRGALPALGLAPAAPAA